MAAMWIPMDVFIQHFVRGEIVLRIIEIIEIIEIIGSILRANI
jgi:hypothetical protein